MRTLTVLYDARCGFCSACRRWLEGERQLVRLEFVPADSDAARERFPTLAASREPEEIVVVGDDGGVYRGPSAYVVCLWALQGYRTWSHRLARPALLPLARSAFAWLTRNRLVLSKTLNLVSDASLAARLASAGSARPCTPASAEACSLDAKEGA